MRKQSTLCFAKVGRGGDANQGVKDPAACLSDLTNRFTLHGRSSLKQQVMSRHLPARTQKLEMPITSSMLEAPAPPRPQQTTAQHPIDVQLVGNASCVDCHACQARASCSSHEWCLQTAVLNLTVSPVELAAAGPAVRAEGVPDVPFLPGVDMATAAGIVLEVRLPGFSDKLICVCLCNTAALQAVVLSL